LSAVPNTLSGKRWLPGQLSASGLWRVKALVWLLCMLPLLRLLWGAYQQKLGANPIEFITRSTGTWTLVFLCITLAVTPLRQLTGLNWLQKLRRLLGLWAFAYAFMHASTWTWFDQWFDLGDMWRDVLKRPFITIGMAAFLCLVPLALTSTQGMMKRLGRRWATLHKLIYLIAILGVVHYYWLVKRDVTQPLIYGAVVACLLGYRLWVNAKKRA
jgi:methionine sulfoxide reductase heme-binding subunit